MSKTEETVFIAGENVRNLEIRAVPVLQLDNSGNLDLSKATAVFETPVPVFGEDGDKIGAAHLYQEERLIKADIFIDYASPTRLDIQAGRKVYPMVGTTVSKLADHQVVEVRLESLVLTTLTFGRNVANLNDYLEKN